MGENTPELLGDLMEKAARARRLADVIRDDPGSVALDDYARELDAEITRLSRGE